MFTIPFQTRDPCFLRIFGDKKPRPALWLSVRSAGRGSLVSRWNWSERKRTLTFVKNENRVSAASKRRKGVPPLRIRRMPRLTTRITADDPTRNWALLFPRMRRELSSQSETGGRRIRLATLPCRLHLFDGFKGECTRFAAETVSSWDIVLHIRRFGQPFCDR